MDKESKQIAEGIKEAVALASRRVAEKVKEEGRQAAKQITEGIEEGAAAVGRRAAEKVKEKGRQAASAVGRWAAEKVKDFVYRTIAIIGSLAIVCLMIGLMIVFLIFLLGIFTGE